MFKFKSTESLESSDERYVANIPRGISDSGILLETLYETLQFPGTFGFNWNALFDCLLDFHWLSQKEIVILHHDLPMLPDFELKLYLEILKKVSDSWKVGEEHLLTIVFPHEVKDRISILLIDPPNQ